MVASRLSRQFFDVQGFILPRRAWHPVAMASSPRMIRRGPLVEESFFEFYMNFYVLLGVRFFGAELLPI